MMTMMMKSVGRQGNADDDDAQRGREREYANERGEITRESKIA